MTRDVLFFKNLTQFGILDVMDLTLVCLFCVAFCGVTGEQGKDAEVVVKCVIVPSLASPHLC